MTCPLGCETTSPIPSFPAPISINGSAGSGDQGPSFDQLLEDQNAETESTSDELGQAPRPAAPTDNDSQAVTIAWIPIFAPSVVTVPVEPPVERSEDPVSSGFCAEVQLSFTRTSLIEHKLPPETQAAERASEQIAGKGLEEGKKGSGMAVAKQPPMVFTTSNNEERAAAEKNQPLGVEYIESTGFEQGLERSPVEKPVIPSRRPELPATGQVNLLSGHTERTQVDFSVADAVVAVEKTHQVVSIAVEEIHGHVQLLRTAGQEKLQVVIRPEPGTELHLQITKADGLIHVQARCDGGEFATLESAWTHVQSSLAAQGIRVEPLQAMVPGESHNGHFRNSHGESQREREQKPERFFLEQDTTSTKPGGSGREFAKSTSRGWQRWA